MLSTLTKVLIAIGAILTAPIWIPLLPVILICALIYWLVRKADQEPLDKAQK